MVFSASYADAISCGQVTSGLVPCFGYLAAGGPVPPACCNGVRGLNNAAKTTPDRQTACGCLKGILAANTRINLNNANSLPGKCGISIGYKITPNIDCSKIH
ncbi:TPA: non-specific lipid-transfer protein [Escherichia coli]|nr:non-specific lipid-transfer protein [Escherichia coli]